MARKLLIEEDVLLERLGTTFREVGYDGASLALLSKATGLKKASLYHRFPGGKQEMGSEVLAEAGRWFTEHVITPLAGAGTPRERLDNMADQLNEFYDGGRQSCLLNMLSVPIGDEGVLGAAIRTLFEVFIGALTDTVAEAGYTRAEARNRAERAVALVQGSLVLARGLRSPMPFRRMLPTLTDELLK